MKHILALAVAGALLAACTTSGGTARLDAAKGLADAWASLDGASLAADQAVKAGLLKGQNAATVSQDLKLAQASLEAATSAYQAGAGGSAATQIATAAAAISAILVIVGEAQQGAHQ